MDALTIPTDIAPLPRNGSIVLTCKVGHYQESSLHPTQYKVRLLGQFGWPLVTLAVRVRCVYLCVATCGDLAHYSISNVLMVFYRI